MKKAFVLAALAAFALITPVSSSFAQSAGMTAEQKLQQAPRAPRAINNQTAVACNLCFTCGGDWTVFAGSIRSAGDTPVERGSACSGALQSRTDSSPFLCCR